MGSREDLDITTTFSMVEKKKLYPLNFDLTLVYVH